MGEELVYYVQVIDPVPPSCQDSPYAPLGRSCSATPTHEAGSARPAPSPDKPGRVEFVRRAMASSEVVGDMVAARWDSQNETVERIAMLGLDNRRVRRALRRWEHAIDADPIEALYGYGVFARVVWYAGRSHDRLMVRESHELIAH